MNLLLQTFLLGLLARGLHGATYSIVHPKLFRIDTDEKVVVNLHGYGNTAVRVFASFTDYPKRRNIFSKKRVDSTATNPIEFTMKITRDNLHDAVTIDNKRVELEIRIEFRSGGHSQIRKKVIVYLTGESDYIFVQTDRPIYKPGETVIIRAIPLDTDMLPLRRLSGGGFNTVEIKVETVDGVGIWKEEQRFPDEDFPVVEYEIPKDPPLGTYYASAKIKNKLHTSSAKALFKIDKYVLPMYNVEVTLDKRTVEPEGYIEGIFKATYSYGEPVVGTYAITATLHVPGENPMTIYTKPSQPHKRPGMLWKHNQGKNTIKISTSQATVVSEMSWDELMEAKATISFIVSVVGQTEGIDESVLEEGILITNTPYVIDVTHTSKYFVPQMLQNINIIVRNVVTNERVANVPVKVFKGNGQIVGTDNCDEKGAASVDVETTNVDEIEVTVKTADSALSDEQQAKKTFTLQKFTSNHGYLRMSAPSHAAVNSDVHIGFKTKMNPESDRHPPEIYYMVLSRGAIILSGKRTRPDARNLAQRITITRKMTPSIRVVGYFVNNNHVVSDSLTIDVDDVCISEELTITLERDEVQPGTPVRLSYKGQPNALVGTSAVDRAAYFLNSEGRLDREQMFDKMNSFDMGCSVLGGEDGFNVFEEAGLALATSLKVTPFKVDLNCTHESDNGGRRRRSATGVQFEEEQDIFYSGKRSKRSPPEKPKRSALGLKCAKQGRHENQADIRCHERVKIIRKRSTMSKIETDECIAEFLEGCIKGETIRNTSAFTATTARQSGARIDIASSAPNVVRKDFKEAWLFTAKLLDGSGRASQSVRPPDSITTFDIDALSVHETQGFCVAKPVELKVFKDFFIQLYLPYSVKVMEQVQIRAAVFNYHKTKSRTFDLKIKGDENICMAGSPGEWSDVATLTVNAESSQTFVFTTIPLSVPKQGYSLIRLDATSTNDRTARDVIEKQIKIEESGNEEEFSGSFELNPKLRKTQRIEFEFPDTGVLPETRKCWIYGHMSFLGPIIEFDTLDDTPKNLGDSIRLPDGCGEQNMKRVGPNVYVFEYLSFRNHATARTQSQIKRYIMDGYARQQSHRNGKRWSVWSHSTPSIWLNAYVNKAFLNARIVWSDMDIRPICESLAWLITKQQNDGSYYEPVLYSHRFHGIRDKKGVTEAMTAYVLIAFAENRPPDCPDKSLTTKILEAEDKAFNYLKRTVHNNRASPYAAAMITYALALVDVEDSATRTAHQRLLKSKLQSHDSIFWKGYTLANDGRTLEWHRTNPGTVDIETTAYALLAEVTIAERAGSSVSPSTVDRINMIARWMVSQKNERGGFKSSQTTVISIQSMTTYAKWNEALEAPPRNPHLNLRLTSERGTSWQNGHSFTLDENNEFYRKEQEIPKDVVEGSRTINVAIQEGEGRGSLSYRCVYRQTKNSDICDFNIIATTSMVGYRGPDGISEAAPDEGMNVIKLVLEISKTTPGDTGMAIVDISMISGFRPVRSSVEEIEIAHAVDGVIDEDTESPGKIELYVDKIPGSDNPDGPLRFGFKMQQHVQVNNPNPAKIVVYDYYEPKTTCSKFYAVPGDSPMVRTSCSSGENNEQQCRCAEGACPKCRTRQDQLLKTLNLRNEICQREYGMFAEVLEVDDTSVPMFVQLRARVDEVFFSKLSDNVLKNQERTFVIRKDCYQNCKDDSLKTLNNPTYFAVGQTFLISGKQPERTLKSGNQESFDYYLDDIGLIERTMSSTKCDKFMRKWEKKCERSPEIKQCKRVKLCNLQDEMKKKVLTGCD